MSTSYIICEICEIGFDAANDLSLFCNMCACAIGSCCKDDYLDVLSEEDKKAGCGEMAEDKCPFCNGTETTDWHLLHFALKKLKMTQQELNEEYKKEKAAG